MNPSLLFHGLAALLVVLYVNTFVVWQLLSLRFEESAALAPWLFAVGTSFVAGAVWYRWRRRGVASLKLIVLAGAIALAGMMLTDPLYPAKRVHVPQYMILAVVVWAALATRVQTRRILFFTVLIAGLYGVHDEFLQGLHPDRSFGWRDMVVNLAGIVAGALMIEALIGQRLVAERMEALPKTFTAAVLMCLAGLGLYILAVLELRASAIPYWSVLPMLAGAFALAWAVARDDMPADARHVGTILVWLVVALSLYPVIVNETSLVFA